jgi:hypothetical protein
VSVAQAARETSEGAGRTQQAAGSLADIAGGLQAIVGGAGDEQQATPPARGGDGAATPGTIDHLASFTPERAVVGNGAGNGHA